MLARREMAQLHRHMRSLRRALVNAERTLANFPEGLNPVVPRLAHLDQDFEVMEARARFFHDEIDAKLASETNRQLYVLSALTAAFLPPTLVAGLFGMNFEGLPWAGSSWGFYIALGLCLLSSAAVWLFLWTPAEDRQDKSQQILSQPPELEHFAVLEIMPSEGLRCVIVSKEWSIGV